MNAIRCSTSVLAAIVATMGFTAANQSAAQQPDEGRPVFPSRYEVEVIIFRHLDQSRNTPEMPAAASMIEASPFDLSLAELPDDAAPPPGATSATAERGWKTSAGDIERTDDRRRRAARRTEAGPEFILLPLSLEFPDFVPFAKENFKLNRIYNRLARLDAYEPLAHLGWIQPAKSTQDAKPFAISSAVVEPASVTGTVTLYKERYLHLALNLALDAEPEIVPIETIDEPPTERVFGIESFVEPTLEPVVDETHKLQQSRRIRISRTHYFDHPQFGVIATVNEIETIVNPSGQNTDSG